MKVIAAASQLALSGCATLQDAGREAAAIADAKVELDIWGLCAGNSVGAIRRKFNTPKLADLWQRLCSGLTDSAWKPAPNWEIDHD